jgi:RNA polymerase sigma factor (sigma-70 family)
MTEPGLGRRIQVGGEFVQEASFLEALVTKEPDATRRLVAQIKTDHERRDKSAPGLVLFSKAFRGKLLGYLRHEWFPGDSGTVEEAWNDTLYRVWSRIDEFDASKSAFLTWATNQARYAALDLRRQRSREAGEELVEEVEEEETPEKDWAERISERDALRRAFRRLSEAERRLLWLRHVEEYKNVEIAREGLAGRELPEEHVRVYVNRAAQRLRKLYEEELAAGERR